MIFTSHFYRSFKFIRSTLGNERSQMNRPIWKRNDLKNLPEKIFIFYRIAVI